MNWLNLPLSLPSRLSPPFTLTSPSEESVDSVRIVPSDIHLNHLNPSVTADVAASRSARGRGREGEGPLSVRPSLHSARTAIRASNRGRAGRLLIGGKEGEADVGVVKRKLVWSPMQRRAVHTSHAPREKETLGANQESTIIFNVHY